ncbi:hypothetical protein N9N28_13115 [Rubripirellula amarantea]|uniref:Uncharacterized protein n=1 Tax=Rubripirellula amarantea TaxID=2527999 RepID=A0A5C5WG34_9BACT|nr:hypothetical protein [Rubripirellula amarantea]MDA8745566.1 hypothetical protein [Rubripirellula amarantea]TWT49728.1 hypothetical protein Pla22_49290 [Rubripirellula amarantea]
MKFVIIGVLLLFLIGFGVLIWKASKNWRWYQIVPVVITMLLAIALLFPTAGVLKSRAAWHKVKEKLEVQAAQVESEYQSLKYGDASGTEGVTSLATKLSKIGLEAGRSWRNLRLQGGTSQSLILVNPQAPAVAPAEPAEDGAAAAAPPLIPEGLVVYGFAEFIDPNTQIAVPTFYLGEFIVKASTEAQVTLEPTSALAPAQAQAIDSQQAISWSVYELLPLDGHEPFIADGSSPNDDNILGRVDDALVNSVLSNTTPETRQSYLGDGRRLRDNDPPLSRWAKIEFTQNHAIQVDSPEQRGAVDGGFFDGNGRAVDGRLQRGEDGSVKFKKTDQIVMQEEAAEQLVDSGVAKLIDRYYLRPLNDYRFVLRHIQLRLANLANRSEELVDQKAVLQEAIDRSNTMLVANAEIKIKLEADLKQFRVETEAIREYTDTLTKDLAAMKKEMARLHKQNVALEQRLDQIHQSVERSVNAVTMVP